MKCRQLAYVQAFINAVFVSNDSVHTQDKKWDEHEASEDDADDIELVKLLQSDDNGFVHAFAFLYADKIKLSRILYLPLTYKLFEKCWKVPSERRMNTPRHLDVRQETHRMGKKATVKAKSPALPARNVRASH